MSVYPVTAVRLHRHSRGVATGVYGVHKNNPPKISPGKLFMGWKWRQNGNWTWILQFYTSPKTFIPPQNEFLATPLRHSPGQSAPSRIKPSTHRRRDSTVELSSVGRVNAPVGTRDPVYNFLCCWAIEADGKWRYNDVIVEKVMNIDQNSRIVKPLYWSLCLPIQFPNCRPNPSAVVVS